MSQVFSHARFMEVSKGVDLFYQKHIVNAILGATHARGDFSRFRMLVPASPFRRTGLGCRDLESDHVALQLGIHRTEVGDPRVARLGAMKVRPADPVPVNEDEGPDRGPGGRSRRHHREDRNLISVEGPDAGIRQEHVPVVHREKQIGAEGLAGTIVMTRTASA